jgi:hypothetical protein
MLLTIVQLFISAGDEQSWTQRICNQINKTPTAILKLDDSTIIELNVRTSSIAAPNFGSLTTAFSLLVLSVTVF